ncbi:MAG: selenide, water dikinase SelD [Bacteroidota bacterium]
MDPIYLDYNATTPLDPMVSGAMKPFLEGMFGNPSSLHDFGRIAAQAVIQARKQVASMLNCIPDEVVFSGGGTESNNYAIKGVAFENRNRGNHIITSVIEHPAVAEVCAFLEREDFEVTWVEVDPDGIVDPEDIRRAIRPGTILITIMHANNETGSIQPITEISRITKEAGVLFHTDAAQSVGKISVDVNELGIDLLSVAGHKLYAPKGVGALYIRRGVKLTKLMHGADHEANRRAGTENVIGIVGLGKAAELVCSWQSAVRSPQSTVTNNESRVTSHESPLKHLCDLLFDGIREAIPEVRLNGHPENRLPNTLSLGFPGVEANTLLQAMKGVASSAGAACHAGEESVSGVLSAMHVPMEYAMGTIRFSVGRMTTEEEIRRAIPIIVKAYREIKGSRFKIQLPPNPLKGAYSAPQMTPHHPSPSRGGSKSHPEDLGVTSGIRLTEYTRALGCACKIRPQLLEEILRKLPPVTDPNVLVGPETSDDAAVYQLNETQALVQTVDVIPPVVDDPFSYGMIATANALSDVYAMGGKPLFALNIVGFPDTRLPMEVLHQIQEGASAKALEAGIQILGGHSIELTEPVFGLTVTGVVDPRKVIRNRGIKVSDVLILTKPLGTGILTTALKHGFLDQIQTEELLECMSALNKQAAEEMNRFNVHACTDISGFGLLGHLLEMIAGDQVNVLIGSSKVLLLKGVIEMAAQGIIPGGTRNNLEYISPFVIWGDQVSDLEKMILCDAQTSGGLLIALDEAEAKELVTRLKASGIRSASLIAKAVAGEGKMIIQSDYL